MSYLKKRGKNSWRLTISLGTDSSGKRIRKRHTINAKNKSEAKHKAIMIEAKYLRDGFVPDIKYTIEEYFIEWFNRHKSSLKKTTKSSYEMIINKHIIPALGHIKLKEISPQHLRNYYNKKLDNGRIKSPGGLSSTTVHGHHVIINHALKDAKNDNLINRNPAQVVNPPQKKKHHDYTTLNPEQIEELLDKSKEFYPEIYDIVYFTLYTGLRRGEVLGLRHKDVDIDNNIISIKQNLLRNPDGGKPIITTLKSKSSYRKIPLTKDTLQILLKIKERHHKQNLFEPNQLVFFNINGNPLKPSTFSKKFKRLVNKCSFTLTFHELRHTHGTMLFKNKVHPIIVQSRLGHSNISTTLDIYTHDDSEIQIKAMKDLEESNYNIPHDN